MIKTSLAILTLVSFLVTGIVGPVPAYSQDYHLPAPGVMVHLSPPLDPPMLKGIKVHPDNPFRFDFILDKGDSQLTNDALKDESSKLIKYFLASLTIPEKDLWVNLSPYEKDRIIPQSFGLTEMGRDLLAEDYMLKQITASLIYPEDEIGKKFWKRVYEEARKKYGTIDVPVNTFNKVWIVPEKAVVYENAKAGTAYVVESKLKVMLEQDYLSFEKHEGIQSVPQAKNTNQLSSQIIREIVIPELTTEVNENKNFVKLRQVYNSLILATWYKKKIKDSILEQVYANKNKVSGVNIDPQDKEKIYHQYLRAFKKGVFNYIKEDIDPATQETIPRKYFSGGFNFAQLSINPAMREATDGEATAAVEKEADNPSKIKEIETYITDAGVINQANPTESQTDPVALGNPLSTTSEVPENINLAHQNGRLNQAMNVEQAPEPTNPPLLDSDKVNKFEEEGSTNPEIKRIKAKIIAHITHVRFAEFRQELNNTVDRLNEYLNQHKEPYSVLWDYKMHSSRRWVYYLARDNLKVKPIVVSWFQRKAESRTHALRKMADQGVKTFVIMDDASYSLGQIRDTIEGAVDLYRAWGMQTPKFLVAIPFMTEVAIKRLREIQECEIVLFSSVKMPPLSEILTPEESSAVGITYTGSTLTYFDHRLADDHSFTEKIGALFYPNYRKPYNMPETRYYQQEEREFNQYFNPQESSDQHAPADRAMIGNIIGKSFVLAALGLGLMVAMPNIVNAQSAKTIELYQADQADNDRNITETEARQELKTNLDVMFDALKTRYGNIVPDEVKSPRLKGIAMNAKDYDEFTDAVNNTLKSLWKRKNSGKMTSNEIKQFADLQEGILRWTFLFWSTSVSFDTVGLETRAYNAANLSYAVVGNPHSQDKNRTYVCDSASQLEILTLLDLGFARTEGSFSLVGVKTNFLGHDMDAIGGHVAVLVKTVDGIPRLFDLTQGDVYPDGERAVTGINVPHKVIRVPDGEGGERIINVNDGIAGVTGETFPDLMAWKLVDTKVKEIFNEYNHAGDLFNAGDKIQADEILRGLLIRIKDLEEKPQTRKLLVLHKGVVDNLLRIKGGIERNLQTDTGSPTGNISNTNKAMKGGIDLTPANYVLQSKNSGESIKFHFNPAQLVQLQNATGFVPVIINIQPLINLSQFLGLNQNAALPTH